MFRKHVHKIASTVMRLVFAILRTYAERFCSHRDIMDDPDSKDVYLRRHFLIRLPWFGIYLHNIRRSDRDRHLHDHPWPFCSLVLAGYYYEYFPDGTFLYREPGSLVYRGAREFHRVKLISESMAQNIEERGDGLVELDTAYNSVLENEPRRQVWTLVIRFGRQREWGFLTETGWVHWKKYTNRKPAYLPGSEEVKEYEAWKHAVAEHLVAEGSIPSLSLSSELDYCLRLLWAEIPRVPNMSIESTIARLEFIFQCEWDCNIAGWHEAGGPLNPSHPKLLPTSVYADVRNCPHCGKVHHALCFHPIYQHEKDGVTPYFSHMSYCPSDGQTETRLPARIVGCVSKPVVENRHDAEVRSPNLFNLQAHSQGADQGLQSGKNPEVQLPEPAGRTGD